MQGKQKNRLVVDAHCDTLWAVADKGHRLGGNGVSGVSVTLERLRKGDVGVQFFSLFAHKGLLGTSHLGRVLVLMDSFYHEQRENPSSMVLIDSPDNLQKALVSKRIGCILSLEGCECLEGDLGVLRMLYHMGVRAAGLTWNRRNALGDGVGEGLTACGLSRFGQHVVQEMNRLGMLVDVAHLAEAGFWDVVDISSAPIIATHTACFSLMGHPRNLTDAQLQGLARSGGVACVTLVPDFLGEGEVNLATVISHINHAVELVGPEHVGLGSDFEGTDDLPQGMEDPSKFPQVAEGLLKLGYKEEAVDMVMGGSILRLLREVLK